MTTRFNWTDPDTAKNEYGDFLATLQEELGRDQCILTDGSIMRPVPPPTVTPTGVAIDTLQLHGYQHAYRKEYNEFQAKFSNGISIVNKLHVKPPAATAGSPKIPPSVLTGLNIRILRASSKTLTGLDRPNAKMTLPHWTNKRRNPN